MAINELRVALEIIYKEMWDSLSSLSGLNYIDWIMENYELNIETLCISYDITDLTIDTKNFNYYLVIETYKHNVASGLNYDLLP